jgi:hypothetical protein
LMGPGVGAMLRVVTTPTPAQNGETTRPVPPAALSSETRGKPQLGGGARFDVEHQAREAGVSDEKGT